MKLARTHCLLCGTWLPCKHGPHGFRGVSETRTLPVRELTPEECRQLLVHNHQCGRPRQKAYLYVASTAISDGKAGPEMYFKPEECAVIKAWIQAEDAKAITH